MFSLQGNVTNLGSVKFDAQKIEAYFLFPIPLVRCNLLLN